MSKKLSLIFFTLCALAGTAGAVTSAAMFVMAIRFGELGRVIVYFILCVSAVELTVYSAIQLIKRRKQQ